MARRSKKPRHYFYPALFGDIECDHTIVDDCVPKLGTLRHRDPPHWYYIARLAKDRDKWMCRTCGANFNLEVHHCYYGRWEKEQLEDVTTLCRECHKVFHQYRRLAG